MKGSRTFFIAAGACVVALVAFYLALVSPVAQDISDESDRIKNLTAESAGYFKSAGKPIGEVEAALDEEKARLAQLSETVKKIELSLPPSLRPTNGDASPLYFQQRLAELGAEAAAGGIVLTGKAKQLGFAAEVPEDKVDEYLARLGVARRFLKAAKLAGITSMVAAENPSSRTVIQPEATVELEELVYVAKVQADEKGLIRLIQEISRQDNFLALKGLHVVVSDPAAGVFEAELEVAGVRARAVEEREPSTQETTTPDRGTSVPVRRRRF
jgi:hypothetical protein